MVLKVNENLLMVIKQIAEVAGTMVSDHTKKKDHIRRMEFCNGTFLRMLSFPLLNQSFLRTLLVSRKCQRFLEVNIPKNLMFGVECWGKI